MKILIVDDQSDIADLLETSVSVWGYSSSKATDAKLAIELLLQGSYDVLITDGQMPGMNGYDLCRYVRSKYPDMFIIGITGSLDFSEFIKAGADTYLRKPFSFMDLHKLLETIESAL